jgi:hypothetical protein
MSLQISNPKIKSKKSIIKISNLKSSILTELKDKNISLNNSDTETEINNLSNSESDSDTESEIDYSELANNDLLNYKIKIDSRPDDIFINQVGRFINRKVKTSRVKLKNTYKFKRTKKITKEINHEVVTYKNNNYVVCCVPFNDDSQKMFVIDYENKDDVIYKSWHFINNYVAHTYYIDKINKKELYLHNLVMNKLTFEGQGPASPDPRRQGQQHTIDHINRIGTDNRKVNLREVVTQTSQNFNQKRRERTTELPDDCGINTDQIPKNIYYGKPSGLHGDFFYIELKGINSLCPDGKKYNWKSTKSKSVDLQVKLQQTIDKLMELKNQYPELSEVIIDEVSEEIRKRLIDEYNNILCLSHYPEDIININLIDFKSDITQFNINDDINDKLDKIKVIKDLGKKKDNLPIDCEITIDMIPKYCYFKPETEKRGCKFIIDRHPLLIINNERTWATTESKKISIKEKFNQLNAKLNDLKD